MEGSAHSTGGVGKPARSWLVESICQHFRGTAARCGAPSRRELVPRTSAGAKLLLNYSCTVSAGEGVRDYVLKDGSVAEFWDTHVGTLAVLKAMSAIAIISTFDFSYIFSPKTYIIFWLFAAYWSATGCRLPGDASDNRVHYSSLCSHFTSLRPPLLCAWHFQLPCSKELGQEGILIPPLSPGPVTQCNLPVREAFSPQSCLPFPIKCKQWALVDLSLVVFCWRCPRVQTTSRCFPDHEFGGRFLWAKRDISSERLLIFSTVHWLDRV